MRPTRIILHHSLTKDGRLVSWDAIRRYHTYDLGWRDIGYHFGIELVGATYEILIGRMLNEQGAHTRGLNDGSIGICFVGNFDLEFPDPRMWDLGLKLVGSLCEVLRIPFRSVTGHRDHSHKSCPGWNFDLGKFVQQLNQGGEP